MRQSASSAVKHNVAFLLLCWMALPWMSFYWVSWCRFQTLGVRIINIYSCKLRLWKIARTETCMLYWNMHALTAVTCLSIAVSYDHNFFHNPGPQLCTLNALILHLSIKLSKIWKNNNFIGIATKLHIAKNYIENNSIKVNQTVNFNAIKFVTFNKFYTRKLIN